jgi:ribonuclease M5
MLKIKEAVIVEGKYDKLKLSNFLDTLIIETNGFGIYKDKEKLKFIRKIANERGIVVLTDSDHSGFQIRNYISAGIPKDKIKHLYIPDILGKEKRKAKPSKEGKLGVEGIDDDILMELFNSVGISSTQVTVTNPVTNYDLFELGFSGAPNAKENKKKLLKVLNLPEFLSTNSLLSYINSSMEREEFFDMCSKLN